MEIKRPTVSTVLLHQLVTLLIILPAGFLVHGITAPNRAPLEISELLQKRCDSNMTKPRQLNIGLMVPTNDTRFSFSRNRVRPSVLVALQSSPFLLQNFNCTVIDIDTSYSSDITMNNLFNTKVEYQNVHLYLGPVNDYCISPVVKQLRFWNGPLITVAGMSNYFFVQKKTTYPMMTRVGQLAGFEKLVFATADIFREFEFQKLKMLYSDAGDETLEGQCFFAAQAFYTMHYIFARDFEFDHWRISVEDERDGFTRLLKEEVGHKFSVIIMCASSDSVREIMLEAHRLGFTNGEYIFFNIDLFGDKDRLEQPWFDRNRDDNEEAQEAFQSLMTITLKKPDHDKYAKFSEEVKEKAEETNPDFKYDEKDVNSFVGAFHDAVVLYALALNETLSHGGNITNGTEITSRMWNKTFEGITGNVSIDANGDRNADYSLMNYNRNTKKFDVAGNYLGSSKEFVKARDIHWAGGRTSAPPDTPICGFDGTGCPEKGPIPPWKIVTVAFCAILLIIAFIGFFVYRKYKFESELNKMSWRIRSQDIIFAGRRGGSTVATRHGQQPVAQPKTSVTKLVTWIKQPGSVEQRPSYPNSMHEPLIKLSYAAKMSSGSRRSRAASNMGGVQRTPNSGARGDGVTNRRDSRLSYISRLSVDSMGNIEPGFLAKQQMFTQTGFYKSNVVALKSVPVKSVLENRALLMDIKSLKDLQNDHIVRFIGICLDPDHEYIITEYCQKGSLQDILENEQIQLDAMFKHSLIQDIAKGMDYLHNSVVRYHGNLKSTNCVVDSRFVLKITDFGLKSLRNCAAQKRSLEDDDKYQLCKRKLWTAPELIDSERSPTVQAYQKGDVYSFAIICQEVIYRMGVFYMEENDTLSPEEIIDTLREDRTFRPTLHDVDCDITQEATLVRKSWALDPIDRPDFSQIKANYRRFMKHSDGKGGNLVDNLLSRMEQYANNLESLVEERTADYLEEKKRAEDLLYMMLPKSIASILIKGETVSAEWFDDVTIYFSDICGFTALSAESTPMQVVALLNDLYTAFDNIIEEFDVYKVETIGDAYMVVSGLPNKNGINHAREIARMSLKLLAFISTFKIRHKPDEKIKLRIGMHSGPVCAGVVGLKMPRYCLFGDTVNTASRMESNGLPLKIHVSPSTKDILDKVGYFDLELRGNIEMKGKGLVTTYWLLGDNTPTTSASASNITTAPASAPLRIKPGFRRRQSFVPSIPEEEMLGLPHSNDFTRSAPIVYPQQETDNARANNNTQKSAKFKENGFDTETVNTPLLNGHAEETALTKV